MQGGRAEEDGAGWLCVYVCACMYLRQCHWLLSLPRQVMGATFVKPLWSHFMYLCAGKGKKKKKDRPWKQCLHSMQYSTAPLHNQAQHLISHRRNSWSEALSKGEKESTDSKVWTLLKKAIWLAPSEALSHHFGKASTQRGEKQEKGKSMKDTKKRLGERWKRLMRTNGGGKKQSKLRQKVGGENRKGREEET